MSLRDAKAVVKADTLASWRSREARDLAAKAKEIEDVVYVLKAVNPHKKPDVDDRTLEELIDMIEAKGREVADALSALRRIRIDK